MALSTKVKVAMPENGVIIRRNGKYNYVYKVTSTYRDENGRPTNTRTSIGKMDAESGMLLPNDNYWQLYEIASIETLPAFNSIRSIGATYAVKKILETIGAIEILKKVFDEKRATQIETIAIYMACRGNVMEHILDWCEGFTLHEESLCDKQASALFAGITHDERMSFFREWTQQHREDKNLAYDVTSLSSYADGIDNTEWGYNRDGDKLPQINLGCYLGYDSVLPMFYVTYSGSIIDKSHMKYMMAYNDELGINDVTFVMDRGFCSTENVRYMHSKHMPYILGVEMRNKATLSAVDTVRSEIISMRKRIDQGVYADSVRGFFYGEQTNLHIYYDPQLAESQRADLYRTVEVQEEKLSQLKQLTKRETKRFQHYFDIVLNDDSTFTYTRNYDKVDAAALNNGFFCLISSTALTGSEVLSKYRRKDVIEKNFDDLKNHIDMKRMRTHTSQTTDGKLFCAFISLIAVSQMNRKLTMPTKKLNLSKNSVISELEKIKVVFASEDRWHMNPITKTQRVVLETLDISEVDIKGYVCL